MKPWGLSKRGALFALLLLISGTVLLPPSVRAQGRQVWGQVIDCAAQGSPVAAQVTLVDAHGQLPPLSDTTDGGVFQFPLDSPPGHFLIQVQPTGFTHYTNEDGPFRFDGTQTVFRSICVDKMPTKNRNVDITVLDAEPTLQSQTVSFASFARGPENVTETDPDHHYDPSTDNFTLGTKPLAWGSAKLLFTGPGVPRGGVFLKYGLDYYYSTSMAFDGSIHINSTVVQNALTNTSLGTGPRGWVEVTYRNVTQSSVLAHGHIASATFYWNGTQLNPYTSHLSLNQETGEVTLFSTLWHYGVDELRAEYYWSAPINQASVTIVDPARKQPIQGTLQSGATGRVTTTAYDGSFDVRIEHKDYQTEVFPLVVSADVRTTFNLSRGFVVQALAVDSITKLPVTTGLVGALINNNTAANPGKRILLANTNVNRVSLHAYNATYLLVVDANGYEAHTQNVTVSGAPVNLGLVELTRSPQELFVTEVSFRSSTDLNNLTVFRNVTLLEDSIFPAIGNASVHNLAWQIDLRFGAAKDGNIADALPSFNLYLLNAGPLYVVTDEFFVVNGKTYISNGTYTASASPSGTNLVISSRQDYRLRDPTKPIAASAAKYFVNVTTLADQNQTVYQNYSFLVRLPLSYEMTSKTTVGQVDTRDFVNVTVDPRVDPTVPKPRVNMVVEKSAAGIATAAVEGPVGKVFVNNSARASYNAWVANDTAIVFSANATTGGHGEINVRDANFTWEFRNATTNATIGTRWGIWTTFDFGAEGADFIVNLTVTQVNRANQTWHQINVTVDNQKPHAVFTTNRTTVDNPPELTVKEDLVTKFDGTRSFDKLWGDVAGEVAEWNWDFESDGIVDRTGKIVTFNYSKPGTFKMNLTVVDRVGHKSDNATLNVTVLDTSPPSPALTILDENNSWRETTQLSEGKGYWFNASQTTDNSLNRTEDNVNLTFAFDWGDGTPKTGPFKPSATGLLYINVSHTYVRHGEFNLSINVTDAAGNHGFLNRTLVVQANASAHPDLSIETGSLKITPTSPEEGGLTTFRFVVKNAEGKVNATDLRLEFFLIVRGQDDNETDKVVGLRYLNPDGTSADRIKPGDNVTVEFKYAPPTLGNKSLKIKIWDGDEPKAWITGANEVTTSLVVREAGWKIWAWVGAFLFIIIGLPSIYYVVRKVRAGELHLPRRRREEEDEEEEEEDEDEDEMEEVEGEKARKKRL